MSAPLIELSVVVPCFDEEAGLAALVAELKQVLPTVARDFEVVLVDDGSSDRTLPMLREAAAADPRFRYLALSRNFGKESAMLAGLSHARGEAVAIIDADLQHPPQLLAKMVPLLDQGYEQVVARRTRTGDPAVRTALSRAYYRMINRLVDVHLEDGVGDFRVMSRSAVRALLALGEYNRFSKGLFSWIGFTTAMVDYENVSREAGQTKWRMRDLFNYGLDGILSFNTRPLRLAIYFGVLVAAVTVRLRRVGARGTRSCTATRCPATSPPSASWSASARSRWSCSASSASTSAGSTPRPSTGRTSWSGRAATPDTAVTVQLGPEREQPHAPRGRGASGGRLARACLAGRRTVARAAPGCTSSSRTADQPRSFLVPRVLTRRTAQFAPTWYHLGELVRDGQWPPMLDPDVVGRRQLRRRGAVRHLQPASTC